MENTNHKKDESVKTGLQIEAEKTDKSGNITAPEINETDPDELVHDSKDEIPDADASEQDMDDLVHKHPEVTPVNELEEIDPDDLIHEGQNDLEEDDH